MDAYSLQNSEIGEFFCGKSVFITGGTGFLGKAIIEKLLRSCPGVDGIYVLIREKRGSDVYTRLDNLMNEAIFDELRNSHPHVISKVVAIAGDITLSSLGISQDNLELLQKTVSVVIHSAATVKFEEPLNVAINANLEGTEQVLELAEKMELIRAVVYVSTAFSNCECSFIEEKVYPAKMDPRTAIKLYRTCEEDLLESMTPTLRGSKPNTYVLTKHLAEELVNQRKMAIPLCIVRPSIITGAYKDPTPGFVDNFNAMSGLLAGVMTGAVHTLLFNEECKLDIIPLDYVANLTIAAAARLGKTLDSNPYIVSETLPLILKTAYENPLKRMINYPHLTLTNNQSFFRLLDLLYHRLPAHIGDLVLGVTGGKRMFLPIYQRFSKSIDVLQYFCTHIWKFSGENTVELYKSLPECDQANFPFDVNGINWDEYIIEYVKGMRKYAFKDTSSVDEGKKALYKVQRIHYSAKYIMVALLLVVICALVNMLMMIGCFGK